MPDSSQSRRSPGRYPSAGTFTPPSPCTGSTITAQVWASMARSTSRRLLKGTCLNPGMRGSKPCQYFSLPVAVTVARVRP